MVKSHLKVSMIIVAANAIIIAFALYFNHLSFDVNLQFLIVLVAGIIFSMIPSIILRIKSRKNFNSTKTVNQYL